MLTNLHVKNLALIKEADIDFQQGLNILTGETGAGKSIILGSVNIALGGKATGDVIRHGESSCLTELTFMIEEPFKRKQIEELGIELEDGEVLISRKISENGRSKIKVNGESVTISEVRALAPLLIDIHGQQDNGLLLSEGNHLKMIDSFCVAETAKVKEKLVAEVANFREIEEQKASLLVDDQARKREIDFLEFEVSEIEEADLKSGEDEELEKKYTFYANAQKIFEKINGAIQALNADGTSVGDMIDSALSQVIKAVEYDDTLQSVVDTLNELESLTSDVSRELEGYADSHEYDEEEMSVISGRLNLLNQLKTKYKSDIPGILTSLETKQARLDDLRHADRKIEELTVQEEKCRVHILSLCDELTKIRKKTAMKLTKDITEALKELNFLSVKFEAHFEKKEHFSENGNDAVTLMISTNPGEDLKPLKSVASGGELSRIMLAVKTVLADRDRTESLIFDEIDAGISGHTAQKVAEKMQALSKYHQIIVITHLPQIAAMADEHFLIEKRASEDSTETRIAMLKREDRVKELARMLGGVKITQAVLDNADEVLVQAEEYKKKTKKRK